MEFEIPFTLTKSEIEDIKKLIEVYGRVTDEVRTMLVQEDTPSYKDVISHLKYSNAHAGVCLTAEKMDIEMNWYMVNYFKKRCVPYTAYWTIAPDDVKSKFTDYGKIVISEKNLVQAVYDSLKVRFNFLNEALILTNK